MTVYNSFDVKTRKKIRENVAESWIETERGKLRN